MISFLSQWSPHVWLFGSVFGVMLSGSLLRRAWSARLATEGGRGVGNIPDFWFRHALWFFVLHVSYVVVGVLAVAGVTGDVSQGVTLLVLVATPLVLVYRSYDSLRLHRARNSR